MAKPFSRAKLDSDREEWVAGKLRPDEIDPWNDAFKPTDQYYATMQVGLLDDEMVPVWDSAAIQELLEVVARYQDKFGVTLPSKDGCPYFCSVSSMPRGWNWLMAFRICTGRFARMRDLCNRKGITIDTPKTVYIFCTIVACIQRCAIATDDPKRMIKEAMKKQYEEFLHLPVVLESVDGLRFALGHLLHGLSMWTGVHPISYDFHFPGGNVVVETCTSNYLKHDYPVQDYSFLLGLVRNIRMAQNSPYWNAEQKINARVAAQDIVDIAMEDTDVFDDIELGAGMQQEEEGEEAEEADSDSIVEGVD